MQKYDRQSTHTKYPPATRLLEPGLIRASCSYHPTFINRQKKKDIHPLEEPEVAVSLSRRVLS